LKKVCDHQIIKLPAIKQENPKAKESRWLKKKEFYNYHHKKGHDTNNWRMLKDKFQDFINDCKLEVDNPIFHS